MTMQGTSWRIAGLVVLALLLGAVFIVIARHPGKYQWDLQTYYYGARAYQDGKNPYDRDVVSGIAETPVRFRYVYPPHTLPVMGMLTRLPLREASLLWLALKGVLVCLLFWVWMRFLPGVAEPGYLLVAVLAFNGAILSDLIAGNISLLEQVLLWSGFLMLRKNLTASALLIAAASFFKVTYAFFLVLPLIVPGNRRGRAFALGLFFVLVPLAISGLVTPGLFQAFLDNAGVLADPLERGDNNPCLFAFLLTLGDVLHQVTGMVVPAGAIIGLFVLHGMVLLVVVWRLVRAMPPSPDKVAASVFLLTLLYPLLVPRFKDYAYILLVPAALSMLMRGGIGGRERWFLVFILVVPTFTLFSAMLPLTEYYLFFAGYALFWWFAVGINGGRGAVPAPSQG
jgi:hypothetical protein